jgi:hypothetical protein
MVTGIGSAFAFGRGAGAHSVEQDQAAQKETEAKKVALEDKASQAAAPSQARPTEEADIDEDEVEEVVKIVVPDLPAGVEPTIKTPIPVTYIDQMRLETKIHTIKLLGIEKVMTNYPLGVPRDFHALVEDLRTMYALIRKEGMDTFKSLPIAAKCPHLLPLFGVIVPLPPVDWDVLEEATAKQIQAELDVIEHRS